MSICCIGDHFCMMIMSVKNNRLSLYITHGGLSSMKVVAKPYKDDEFQVLALYVGDTYSIIINELLRDLLRVHNIFPTITFLNTTDFVEFINSIKILDGVSKKRIRLCCDVNLGDVGGAHATIAYSELVEQLNPSSVVPFTDTQDCRTNASLKLNLPVTDRRGLRNMILTEIDNEPSTPDITARYCPPTSIGCFASEPLFQLTNETSKVTDLSSPAKTLHAENIVASSPQKIMSGHSFELPLSRRPSASFNYQQSPLPSNPSRAVSNASILPNDIEQIVTHTYSARKTCMWYFFVCCLPKGRSSRVAPEALLHEDLNDENSLSSSR